MRTFVVGRMFAGANPRGAAAVLRSFCDRIVIAEKLLGPGPLIANVYMDTFRIGSHAHELLSRVRP